MDINRFRISVFFDELLLFSGQYALFYVLMNFTMYGLGYFSNLGHTFLLAALVLQTAFLVKYGSRPKARLLGSLIAPFFYTLLELREGFDFILNTGHIFFWIFSLIIGVLQALGLKTQNQKLKVVYEFVITNVNVLIFFFIYFYFDLKLEIMEGLPDGNISAYQLKESLEIYNIETGFVSFISDATHIYIITGGIVLSLSLAMGRIKIIKLKNKINELFGTYVDKDIRDKIMTKIGGRSESREICILFSDIRNFSSISENNPPDRITRMLNLYFTEWDNITERNHGVIDKYIGDAVMVLFGISEPDSSCENAVQSAFHMLENLERINKRLAGEGLPVIENIGIGINSGGIIMGDIGSEKRKNFTVVGDNVNIAARLESLCKTHGIRLIVSESTYRQLTEGTQKRFKYLGDLELKGKSEKIITYGIVEA